MKDARDDLVCNKCGVNPFRKYKFIPMFNERYTINKMVHLMKNICMYLKSYHTRDKCFTLKNVIQKIIFKKDQNTRVDVSFWWWRRGWFLLLLLCTRRRIQIIKKNVRVSFICEVGLLILCARARAFPLTKWNVKYFIKLLRI